MSPSVLLIAGIAFMTLVSIFVYNQLVTLKNRQLNAFSQIDVQLKRRHDLIPNLVETAKAYLKHERETLESVIAARNSAFSARELVSSDPANASAMKQLLKSESALASSLSRLMAVMEAYPDLKANQTMAQLSEELTSTENKVSFARQAYNDAVLEYNVARLRFPNVLFSGMFGFRHAPLFELDSMQERAVPKVSFS